MSNLNRNNVTGTGANVIPPPVVHTTAVPVVPVAPVAAVPVAPVVPMQNLSLGEKVVHEPERIIEHKPILEKEVLNEPVLEVKREHHIQPIIHETEHRVQPIIKTEATTERPIIEQDKNVMHAPIVERAAMPAGLEAVERVAPEGVIHAPRIARDVVVEHPVEVRHERHIQPIIHEREHHIQPVIKTEVTAEQTVIERENTVMLPPIIEPTVMVGATTRAAPVMAQPVMAQPAVVATTTLPRTAGLGTEQPLATATTATTTLPRTAVGGLDSEQRLASAGAVPPVLPGEREVYNRNLGATGTTATGGETHVGIGQKLKGAMKEVQGTITRNPAVKEEGRKLMHGETTTSTTGSRTGL